MRPSFASPIGSETLNQSQDESSCPGRQTKGIAEVVAIDATQVWLRFYPGDQLFARPRAEETLFGVRLGDELRAVRGDHCGSEVNFQIVDDDLIDSGIEWAGWREV